MKKIMRCAMAGLVLLLSVMAAKAQTPAENLQTAVETYIAMREYQDGLVAKDLTQSNIDDVKTRMDKGVVLLDKVILEGNADQIKAARYLRNNFKYEYGFIFLKKGEYANAFDVMKEIERDMTAFTAADFPLSFGESFVVNWDNFAPIQAEFLTGMAEACYNLGKYEDAAKANKKAIAHPNTTDWLRYSSVDIMLDIYAESNSLFTPTEYSDYALQSMQEYDKLSDEDKLLVKENDYSTARRGLDILLKDAQDLATPQSVARWATAAPIGVKYEDENPKVMILFELCYRNGHQGELQWHRAAQAYARQGNEGVKVGKPFDKAVSGYVGISATERIAAGTSPTDCAALKEVAEMYGYWGKAAKQAEFKKKAADCLDNEEKARERVEKASRRSNGNFNFYVGANVFPLLTTNPKRDYGGAVNFVFRKAALEFGYAKINRNKENVFDLTLDEVESADPDNVSPWDGFKAHFQPKFFYKSNENMYFGILLGYNEKNFDSMQVNVTNDLDLAYSSETFQPNVKQYVVMLNFGGMNLSKGFGLDMNFGFGANYSSFDPGNPLDRKLHTIDNPLLEYRKDNYFGVVLRLGLTMGLNFGAGR